MAETPDMRKELIEPALVSNESFIKTLKLVMKRQGTAMKELSEGSGIPLSTLNKVVSQERDLRLSTLRDIVGFFQPKVNPKEGDLLIGFIASRYSLDKFSKHMIECNGKKS